MPTPIEMMIDRACGVTDERPAHERWMRIRCPKCAKVQSTPRLKTDPPGAQTVEIVCPKCDDGDFAEPMFFDANGKHINVDPAPQSGQRERGRG